MKWGVAPAFLALMVALCVAVSYAQDKAEVTINVVGYFPDEEIRAGVPFQLVFRIKNTGTAPINPYAEVTLSGEVRDSDDELALRLIDGKFRAYNLWPGDEGGKLYYYIGTIGEKGDYKLKIMVSAYNRGRNEPISKTGIERRIEVR